MTFTLHFHHLYWLLLPLLFGLCYWATYERAEEHSGSGWGINFGPLLRLCIAGMILLAAVCGLLLTQLYLLPPK